MMCPSFSYGSCGFKCPVFPFLFSFTANSDITVVCGTNRMELQILLCPMYFYGYNESMVALNGQFGKPECRGTADWTVNPPVVKFQFYITEPYISVCANKLTV